MKTQRLKIEKNIFLVMTILLSLYTIYSEEFVFGLVGTITAYLWGYISSTYEIERIRDLEKQLEKQNETKNKRNI